MKIIDKIVNYRKKGINIHPPLKKGGEDVTSIAFVSLHKCATTFFSGIVLKEVTDLALVDYQTYEYRNDANIQPIIMEKGYIYAVLRLYDKDHPGYKLTDDLVSPAKLKKIKTIFWVRDPRDILVSLYYSFGFSHGESPNAKIREHQRRRRERIQKMTLDEYVLSEVHNIKWKFEKIDALRDELPNHLFIRYEEMIHDFETFFAALADYTSLDGKLAEQIYRQTRPNKTEDPTKHKRSGKTGAYLDKLDTATIDELNRVLEPTLKKFGYEV